MLLKQLVCNSENGGNVTTKRRLTILGLAIIVFALAICLAVELGGCEGNKITICNIWPESSVWTNDLYGSIVAFSLSQGSNCIVEVSRIGKTWSENTTAHSRFESLLIILPDFVRLNTGSCMELSSTNGNVRYSGFNGRFAMKINRNSEAKALVTVTGIERNGVRLHVACDIPCVAYDPLHVERMSTFDKSMEVGGFFARGDVTKPNQKASPIVDASAKLHSHHVSGSVMRKIGAGHMPHHYDLVGRAPRNLSPLVPLGPNSNTSWHTALKACGHDYNPPRFQPGISDDFGKAKTCKESK